MEIQGTRPMQTKNQTPASSSRGLPDSRRSRGYRAGQKRRCRGLVRSSTLCTNGVCIRLCLRMLGNVSEAEDMTQDAFLQPVSQARQLPRRECVFHLAAPADREPGADAPAQERPEPGEPGGDDQSFRRGRTEAGLRFTRPATGGLGGPVDVERAVATCRRAIVWCLCCTM